MELAVSSLPDRRVSGFAHSRIRLTYLWRHGKLPDLDNPQSYTEWIQWRKLHDRDSRLPLFADKVRAKDIVADQIGPEWIIPTYWHGNELPFQPEWPTPFVVKSRHGSNQYAFVFDQSVNWPALRRRSRRWMARDYGYWLDEWLYPLIPRGLLVEPFIGQGRTLPIDYKFHVFAGRVEFVQVHLDRGGRHRWILFDRNWRRISSATTDSDPAPPVNLHKMIDAAAEIGRGFDYIRVDLYEVDAKPYFGEMTFYPGSGLDPFDPVELDSVLGGYWTRARFGIEPNSNPQQGLTCLPTSP